jgi:hypothetical protein
MRRIIMTALLAGAALTAPEVPTVSAGGACAG